MDKKHNYNYQYCKPTNFHMLLLFTIFAFILNILSAYHKFENYTVKANSLCFLLLLLSIEQIVKIDVILI